MEIITPAWQPREEHDEDAPFQEQYLDELPPYDPYLPDGMPCPTEEQLGVEPSAEETALKQLIKDEQFAEAERWISRFDPLRQQLIRYRFAQEDGQPHSLEETAARFDITRERVRQIENQVLRKTACRVERRNIII